LGCWSQRGPISQTGESAHFRPGLAAEGSGAAGSGCNGCTREFVGGLRVVRCAAVEFFRGRRLGWTRGGSTAWCPREGDSVWLWSQQSLWIRVLSNLARGRDGVGYLRVWTQGYFPGFCRIPERQQIKLTCQDNFETPLNKHQSCPHHHTTTPHHTSMVRSWKNRRRFHGYCALPPHHLGARDGKAHPAESVD
jgi:hypothetical protein